MKGMEKMKIFNKKGLDMEEKELVIKCCQLDGTVLTKKFYKELEDEMDQFTDVDFMSYTKAIIFSMFYTKIDTLHSPELTLNSLSLKEKYEKYSKIHTENSDKVIGIWSTLLSYKNKYVLQLITMMRENKFKCEMVSTSDEESFDIKIKLDI